MYKDSAATAKLKFDDEIIIFSEEAFFRKVIL
jgi:hypothetical protein